MLRGTDTRGLARCPSLHVLSNSLHAIHNPILGLRFTGCARIIPGALLSGKLQLGMRPYDENGG